MIKFSLTIIISLFILNFLDKFVKDSDNLLLFIGDYQIELSQNFALFTVIIAFLMLVLLIYILTSCLFFIKYRKLKKTNNKYSKTIDLVTSYMTNLGLGDFKNSEKSLKKISKSLPNHPLNHLLDLQNNNVNKEKNIIKNLNKLKNYPETKHFALQGLAVIEKNNKNYQEAELYLEESLSETPYAVNTVKALIEVYFTTANWPKLEKILHKSIKQKMIEAKDYNFEQAICFLNLSKLSTATKAKAKYILAAQKMEPNNPEIQINYAKTLLAKKKKITLNKYIKNLWPTSPLSELLELYLANVSNKNSKKKFQLISELINLNPRSETAIIKYVELALLEQKNINKAKLLLKEYLNHINSEKLYDLALRFFDQTSGNIEDQEFYERLMKENSNYNNYTSFICSKCQTQHDVWQEKCNNCTAKNSLKYGYVKALALLKIEHI